jgi:hypothetical protein
MSLVGSKITAFGGNSKGIWAAPDTKPKTFKIARIAGNISIYLKDYDADKDGLIYTDLCFREEFTALLNKHGIALDVCYSESGMQGDDYVNMDITSPRLEN